MADTAPAEPSAASKLLQQHIAAHPVTVEEVPDEEIGKPAASTAGPATTESKPQSANAAGKQKARETNAIDTSSHDLFPELGGPKPAAMAAVPIWNAKSSANGPGPTNGTTQVSAPASGATTPNPATRAPVVTIPGRNTETLLIDRLHLLPRNQLKRPIADILKDVNRKSRAQVTMSNAAQGRLKLEASGPSDAALQAIKDVMNQIGSKQTIKVPIPSSARAHIIGKGGSQIKQLQEETGARIQLPKVEGSAPAAHDDDDDELINVIVEGNAMSAAAAREKILKIAGERTANVSTRLKDIPAELYPFIESTLAHELGEARGIQMRVPRHQPWSAQPPTLSADNRPVFAPASSENLIHLAGDRAAVQAASAIIKRQVEELRQKLALEQLSIQRGRHQFIIGDRGVPVEQFFADTGCAIIMSTDGDDDTVTIIGPSDQLPAGVDRAMDLAMGMQCSSVDISRFHRQAPGGAAAHARNVTRYLRQKKELERLEKAHNVHVNTPFTEEGALPWELFARDGKNAIRAQSEIKGLVDSHPPARMETLPVDPFFHNFLRKEVQPRVRDDYRVHLCIPEAPERNSPVLLVYEGAASPDSYEIPRSQPSQADVKEMQKYLREARSHLESLLSKQEEVKSATLEVPTKYHTKLQKFIKEENEQINKKGDGLPIRVSNKGTTVILRGPRSAVESLTQKCEAFLEQAKQDDKERGFTLEFEFPQKFANHLIGKRGTHIQELREKFDVDIQVQDGKVELKGPKVKAEAAKSHILSLGRALQDETTHILKIEPKFHRELIGAQGAQINRLQTRYKVLIFFPRTAKPPKDKETGKDKEESSTSAPSEADKPRRQQAPDEVIVRGPKKGADEAREELLSLLQYLKDNSFTATVSVQQKQVPSLIGSGGAILDQMRQETGARIDIPGARDAPDAVVEITIKGTKSQVAAAKKLLDEKKAVFEDTVTKTIDVDKKYHRTLIGANGSNVRDIVLKAGGSDDRRELARSIQFPKQDADGNTIKVEGRSDVVDKIIAQIKEFVSQRENQVTEVLEVAPEKHRSLIGRGGETKRGLESQFSVSIDIPRQGSGQTAVKIIGQAPDVEKAKAHIETLVKSQEGETVQIPRALHHVLANNGQFFRKLKADHQVNVDHAGQAIPAKPSAPARANNGATPLITDEDDASADAHAFSVVENISAEEGDIPWVLRGSPENLEKAKKAIASALEQAKGLTATGYLVLPDPKTFRYVIGQGGSKVNSIRKQSGCKITVPRDQAVGEAIEIVGTKEGVEQARDLILEAVREGVNSAKAPREPREYRD